MFARVHRVETTAEQHADGVELVREQLLPWMRESSGFCGLISLLNAEKNEALVVSIWADADALDASAEAGRRLSALANETTGAVRLSLDDYEVTYLEVVRRDDPDR